MFIKGKVHEHFIHTLVLKYNENIYMISIFLDIISTFFMSVINSIQ